MTKPPRALYSLALVLALPMSAASAFPTTASISVNAGQIIRIIPRTIYGANLEWVWDADHAWVPASKGFNPAIVGAAAAMGVSSIRFPGGIYADYYNWQNGVGPQATRPTTSDGPDGGYFGNPVGTEEIIKFSIAIGAVQPMFQTAVVAPVGLSSSTSPAELAAKWVHYTNDKQNAQRAANGSAAPYAIKYWEIGNEQYYNQPGRMPVAQYISTVQAFSAAMKAADPAIQIGAVSIPAEIVPGWQKSLVRGAASSIDFIALHGAYAPNLDAGLFGASFNEVYQAMLAYPVSITTILKEAEQDVATLASPADAARIKFAVTEWGPLFSQTPTSPWFDHTRTLGSALYVASTLAAFARDPKLEMAYFFKLVDPAEMGLLTDTGSPKASAYAFQMFTRHFGPHLVNTTVASPTYDSVHTGWMPATPQVPELDVVSSLDAAGTRLYILVINKSLTASTPTAISLQGFAPASGAQVWTLTAPSIDANNGPDIDPGFLKIVPPILAPVHSMLETGAGPGAVATTQSSIGDAAANFTYAFPPMSVTSIELHK